MNYQCFGVPLYVLPCVHRTQPFPNAEGQTVPVPMKEPSNELMLPATAMALNEEPLKPDNTTPWSNQPFHEFLYAVTPQLFEEVQTN